MASSLLQARKGLLLNYSYTQIKFDMRLFGALLPILTSTYKYSMASHNSLRASIFVYLELYCLYLTRGAYVYI